MMTLKLLCLAAALSWPASAVAGAATSGTRPDPAAATFILSDEAPREVRRCLSDIGMREAEAPTYLVQFSRVARLRKAAVEPGAKDAGDRPRPGRQTGKTLEVASLAFIEVANGKLVYMAQVSRKVRRRPAKTELVNDLCSLVKAPPAAS